jgi:hypothetical protein
VPPGLIRQPCATSFLPASGETSWPSPIEDDPEPPDLNVPNPASRVDCDGGTEVASGVGIAVTDTLAALFTGDIARSNWSTQ